MAVILKEIRILESDSYDSHRPFTRSTTATLYVNSRDHLPKKQHKGGADGRKKQQCVFCKGSHSSHNCNVITDYQRCLDTVKGSNL